MLNILLCGKTIIENILKIKKVKIPNCLKEKKEDKGINNLEKISDIINYNQNIYQSAKLNSNLKDSINSSVKDYQKKANVTSPKNNQSENQSAPPKRKIANNAIINNTNNKKNNRDTTECKVNSNIATSIYEAQLINFNFDKNTSLEDIYDGDNNNRLKNNNYLLNEKNFVENNYLVYKRKRLLESIQKHLEPFDEKDVNKYTKTECKSNIDKKKRKLLLFVGDKFYRKKYKSADIKKLKISDNLNFKNISKIGNKNMRILSQYSEIHGDSEISGTNKFLKDNLENSDYLISEKDKNSNINNRNNEHNKIIGDNESINNNTKNNFIITQNDENKSEKNSKISRNKLNKNKHKYIKSSMNMSVSSNNRFLNSKSERNIMDEEDDKKDKEQNKENEEVIYNKNDILSSIAVDDINESLELNSEKNLFCFYLKYFMQREFFTVSFYNKYDNIPYFIRITAFFLVMTFLFMINCLLLTSSDIHMRYLYAKENKRIYEGNYIFKYEFGKVFACALISIIIKMACIKFIYGKYLFKITSNIKEEISPFIERNLNEDEYIELHKKRKTFIKKYLEKSLIFISIVIGLFLLFGFITVCYIGTFPNTFSGIIVRFILSIFFSFIFCAFICFVIVMFHHFGFLTCFNFIKKIY